MGLLYLYHHRVTDCDTCVPIFTLLYRSRVACLVGTTDKETLGNVVVTSAKSQKTSV